MKNSEDPKTGTLYIVATPIGNLEDITMRALRILKEVQMIAAEDTRHTKKLLNHFGITTPLISYYREKEQERAAEIIDRLLSGTDVALVSDAGTPAISDPGAILVQQAHQKGVQVSPVPGASALTAAVSGSGFTNGTFLFLGFSPAKKSQRKKLLQSLIHCEYPVVFYESPRRIEGFLRDAHEILGDRDVLWAREITKTFEELIRTTLGNLTGDLSNLREKGEFVIIIGPDSKPDNPEGENLEELLVWYRDNSELSMKDICKKLAADLGMSRSKIYQLALTIWKT